MNSFYTKMNEYQTKNQKIKKHLWHIIRQLSNLTSAIIILLLIASFSIIGTLIEQDQSTEFYQNIYPQKNDTFCLLNWKTIKYLQLDHLYTNWWFLSLIIIFICSLAICTFSTQLPILSSARKWKFYSQKQQILNLEKSFILTTASSATLIYSLNDQQYHVFQQNNKIYAYKGLIGRLSPVFVHLSIILLLAGSLLSLFSGFVVQEMIANGETVHLQNVIKSGKFSYIQQNYLIRVNNFSIKYNPNNSIQQFRSNISILTDEGTETKQGIVRVNSPMHFQHMSIYQNDWDIIALRLKLNNKVTLQIPCKPLIQNTNKIWESSFNISHQNTIFIIIPNLKGELFFYNSHGNLIAKTNINKPIRIKKLNINVENIISRTGLQIKTDPGVIIVYSSFMLLILSILVSYTSYSQLWAIRSTYTKFHSGGNTNRGYLAFEEDLEKIRKQNLSLNQLVTERNNH